MNVRSLWAWDSRRIHEKGYGKCWGDRRKRSRQWRFEIAGIRNGRCWLHFKIFYEWCNSFFVALFQWKKFESRYLLPYLQYFGKCWVFNPYHVTGNTSGNAESLTLIMSLFSFFTSWKCQETRCFLVFSGGMERNQWHEMG